jgi:DNA-binding MarR family transcriptional regulator
LQRVALELQHETAELLKAHGLSAPQFNILRILRGAGEEAQGGLATAQIGARLLAHAPDLTRLLDRMEGQALVVRARERGDRRVVTTTITAKGLTLLAELDAPLAALHQLQLAHLGPERLKALLTLLEVVQQRT